MAPAVLWGFHFLLFLLWCHSPRHCWNERLMYLDSKNVFFLGWFDSPEAIHIKPVWRNESRALAAVRGERWKRNGIGSRRMSDWQQESRVHERVPILVIYEHTIFELWRWAFLGFENFFEWNFCWMSWQRKTTFGVYAEGSFLGTASWLLKFESTDALNHVPTRNPTRSMESSNMESLTTCLGHSRAKVRQALPKR